MGREAGEVGSDIPIAVSDILFRLWDILREILQPNLIGSPAKDITLSVLLFPAVGHLKPRSGHGQHFQSQGGGRPAEDRLPYSSSGEGPWTFPRDESFNAREHPGANPERGNLVSYQSKPTFPY